MLQEIHFLFSLPFCFTCILTFDFRLCLKYPSPCWGGGGGVKERWLCKELITYSKTYHITVFVVSKSNNNELSCKLFFTK